MRGVRDRERRGIIETEIGPGRGTEGQEREGGGQKRGSAERARK